PQRPGPGDPHHAIKLDIAPFYRLDSARQRLDVSGVLRGNRWRHFVVGRPGGELHVFCHAAKAAPPEAINFMLVLTHPVLTAPAKAAFPAGHNLFGYGHITDLQAVLVARAFAQCHDFADKFMAGNYRRLAVTGAQFITPEQRRPLITLEIA